MSMASCRECGEGDPTRDPNVNVSMKIIVYEFCLHLLKTLISNITLDSWYIFRIQRLLN
jgi:hypothetical protein